MAKKEVKKAKSGRTRPAKAAALRDKSVEDLKKQLQLEKNELFNNRFKLATSQLEKVSEIPATKRNIARIMTILKEKGA